MNITVYLGANLGNDPALPQAVQQLGRWIGESGNALVYGGSKSGLMGILADSVLAAGGKVTGVEPKCFLDAELQHEGLTELIVTEDMPARKTKMIELGDAFIAFPGGTGTLEEITEVISKFSGAAGRALHPLRPERLLPASAPAFAADDHHGAFHSGAAAEYHLCRRPCSDPRNS